mgnify:CR=1 FL=1
MPPLSRKGPPSLIIAAAAHAGPGALQREYFIDAPDSITRRWLEAGAAGWRLDVSGDPSFPRDYWSDFRAAVEATDPDALTISETWQKDTALLRNVRGDRFDTTMNYRLRDAVLGLLAPQGFDAKGFPDSGDRLSATEFAARLLSQQEDYAPATYYSLMNLLDSHDTERILWTLTPGIENRTGREVDPDNLAEGKARLRLASLIQYAVPGMPTSMTCRMSASVGSCPLPVVRTWYSAFVKSRGRGSIIAAPSPWPAPSTPWQPAHHLSLVGLPG